MSDNQPAPPKKKRKGPIILGSILVVLVVGFAGCAAVLVEAFRNFGGPQTIMSDKELVEGTYRMNSPEVEGDNGTCSITGVVWDENGELYDKTDEEFLNFHQHTLLGSGGQCVLGRQAIDVFFTVTGGQVTITGFG